VSLTVPRVATGCYPTDLISADLTWPNSAWAAGCWPCRLPRVDGRTPCALRGPPLRAWPVETATPLLVAPAGTCTPCGCKLSQYW